MAIVRRGLPVEADVGKGLKVVKYFKYVEHLCILCEDGNGISRNQKLLQQHGQFLQVPAVPLYKALVWDSHLHARGMGLKHGALHAGLFVEQRHMVDIASVGAITTLVANLNDERRRRCNEEEETLKGKMLVGGDLGQTLHKRVPYY